MSPADIFAYVFAVSVTLRKNKFFRRTVRLAAIAPGI